MNQRNASGSDEQHLTRYHVANPVMKEVVVQVVHRKVGLGRCYFNIDSAVLNAQADIIECLHSSIRACGIDVCNNEDFLNRYLAGWGNSLNQLLCELAECNSVQAEEIAITYKQLCKQRGFVKTRVSEDLHGFLHLLRREGRQLHCVSSYIPVPEALLYEKNLHQYFYKVTNTMDCRIDFWEQELQGCDAQRTCMVSDCSIDIRCGVTHKVFTAAVTWGASDVWDLGIETPDVILTNVLECKRFFIDGVLPGG